MQAKCKKNIKIDGVSIEKGAVGTLVAHQFGDAGEFYLMNFPHAKLVKCPKEDFELLT